MATALELVKKVARMGSALRLRETPGQGGARDPTARSLAARATVQMLRVTTLLARRMRELPLPAPRATERLALSTAASQLRAMTASALVPGASDPGSPEAALSELVAETLALVDKLLATDPELTREAAAARLREAPPADDGEPRVSAPRNRNDEESPTKVTF